MGSGCGDLIVERILRPPGKLPVPVALYAGSPTLFKVTIHDCYRKVNSISEEIDFGVDSGAQLRTGRFSAHCHSRRRERRRHRV